MATPSVVEVDPNAPQNLSPIKDYTFGGAEPEWKKDERKNRKSVVDAKNYKEMRSKYQEAKKRMEQLKDESANNRRMLLEMSSVISALKEISIDYDHDDSASGGAAILNVQRKIKAIDEKLKESMTQCLYLEEEKKLQSSTIRAQENQIKNMKLQMSELQNRWEESMAEKNGKLAAEKKTLDQMNGNGEMESTIKAQEEKIAALEAQVRQMAEEKNNTAYLHQQILTFRGANETKYQEIQAMEEKLETLRKAQVDQLGTMSSKHGKPVKYRKPTKNVSFDAETFIDRKDSRSSDHSRSSHSSQVGGRSSLDSISEEESHATEDEDLYSDDRGISYSSRSVSSSASTTASGRGNDGDSHCINITASHDESVEISVTNKDGTIDFSDVSYSTEDSTTASSSENFEKEYNRAVKMVQKLTAENTKLRTNHSQALSDMAQISELTSQANQTKKDYEETKKALEEQKKSATLANTKYAKLRLEHSKVVHELREERAKYQQLAHDYGRIAHREADLANYDQLKHMHNAVVMKMADMGEENESLMAERNATRSKHEQAESKIRELSSELDSTTMAYKDLQKENDELNAKAMQLSTQCNETKTKYYELLAGDQSIHTESTTSRDERYETLRREYETVLENLRTMEAKVPAAIKLQRDLSEALAKITVLEQSNQELEAVRDQYHAADARVTMLERQHEVAIKDAKLAKKREEQRASHLKDLLVHYKTLENEYEEVSQKLKRLQAVMATQDSPAKDETALSLGPAGPAALADQTKTAEMQSTMAAYERRIKELQQQRDKSMEQLHRLEDEISQTRLEKMEAFQARKDREADLKTVLGHYHELQEKYDTLHEKHSALESKWKTMESNLKAAERTHHTVDTSLAVLAAKSVYEKKSENGEPPMEFTEAKFGVKEEVKEKTNGGQALAIGGSLGKTNIEKTASAPETAVKDAPLASGPEATDKNTEEAEQMDDTDRPEPDPSNDDSVKRLMFDMDELKRHKAARESGGNVESKDRSTDLSSVSNVSEGLSEEMEGTKSVLSDEAPSTSWKDVKIAKLLSELEQAKSQVWASEEKEKSALAQLETLERKLLVATREAEEAKRAKTSREGNLRDAIATQKRLEDDYQQSQEAVQLLQTELEKAKKEARMREEETKVARKRAASSHSQFKKLQEKHTEAMKILQDQEAQLQKLTGDASKKNSSIVEPSKD